MSGGGGLPGSSGCKSTPRAPQSGALVKSASESSLCCSIDGFVVVVVVVASVPDFGLGEQNKWKMCQPVQVERASFEPGSIHSGSIILSALACCFDIGTLLGKSAPPEEDR